MICPPGVEGDTQTINCTIMILLLHGTHCCTAWSGLCLLVTLVTSAVVESVEAQRPPLPAWQHQCQCGGGEHRPPPWPPPPPARPSCEKYKDVSQREINDIGGRGRAALGYMLLCSASGARHNTGRGRGGGGRGDKHVGGDCIPTHGHRGLQPMDTLHSITPLYFATIPRNIVYCLTLIQLKTKVTKVRYAHIPFLQFCILWQANCRLDLRFTLEHFLCS